MQRSAEERFQEIYRAHLGAVSAYVRRRAPALAEDVAAETFLICWRRLDDVPETAPWLYAVARNTLANERRKLSRSPRGVAAGGAAEPELPGDQALAVAFARLSEGDREVLRLVAWEALSLGEAAVVLGCSTVACRLRFHRAKRRLAALLESTATARTQPRPEGATP